MSVSNTVTKNDLKAILENLSIGSTWASEDNYCKMPDGTLIQWGIESSASNANITITLPTAFLNTSYSVVATDDYGALSGNYAIGQRTTTSFTIYRGVTTRLQWIAVGRWKAASDVQAPIGQLVADFIVEQGTSDIWTYRKWNSGIAECWGSVYAVKDCTSAWGNVYDSAATSQSFPDGLFASAPTLNISAVGHSTSTLQLETSGATLATRTCNYYYTMPYSATGIQATVNFHALGRWK